MVDGELSQHAIPARQSSQQSFVVFSKTNRWMVSETNHVSRFAYDASRRPFTIHHYQLTILIIEKNLQQVVKKAPPKRRRPHARGRALDQTALLGSVQLPCHDRQRHAGAFFE